MVQFEPRTADPAQPFGQFGSDGPGGLHLGGRFADAMLALSAIAAVREFLAPWASPAPGH